MHVLVQTICYRAPRADRNVDDGLRDIWVGNEDASMGCGFIRCTKCILLVDGVDNGEAISECVMFTSQLCLEPKTVLKTKTNKKTKKTPKLPF